MLMGFDQNPELVTLCSELFNDVNVENYLPGISEDPKLWSNPSKFGPERFVSGKEDADITGVTGVKMMPFGVGRRICPGLSMATVHVHLMLARMVQEYLSGVLTRLVMNWILLGSWSSLW
uniref:Cytochrome P450 n=1 Tax=Quercus lobata TaxID=97700 RepID=A0A7N2LB39_QUELO